MPSNKIPNTTPKEKPLYVSSTPPKSNSGLMVVIIIIVALVAGGGVYAWQNWEAKKQSQAAAEKVRNEMQNKITEAENKLADLQKKLDEQTLINSEENWKTYTNPTLGYSIKYPDSYKIDDHSTDEAVFWQNKDNETVMSIKYRQDSVDNTLDTWFDSTTPKSPIFLSGISGYRFDYKYCDGPSCGQETIAFVIPYQGKLLGLEFVGNYDYDKLEEKILATFTLTNLCTDDPTISAIGSGEYPIDPRYQNLGHLGQLFTASDCNNPERLSKIFGVSGDNYTLGINLSLNNKPSTELLAELKKIGFTCRIKDAENSCLDWKLDRTVKINSIIPLKSFYRELKFSDCIRCG